MPRLAKRLLAERRDDAEVRRVDLQIGTQTPLDLPLVALSNGQTRRARVVKALLAQPELLLLDEPLGA
jgi:ABC-type Mn2+/Zn2+ transport system ATPase subunit